MSTKMDPLFHLLDFIMRGHNIHKNSCYTCLETQTAKISMLKYSLLQIKFFSLQK